MNVTQSNQKMWAGQSDLKYTSCGRAKRELQLFSREALDTALAAFRLLDFGSSSPLMEGRDGAALDEGRVRNERVGGGKSTNRKGDRSLDSHTIFRGGRYEIASACWISTRLRAKSKFSFSLAPVEPLSELIFSLLG